MGSGYEERLESETEGSLGHVKWVPIRRSLGDFIKDLNVFFTAFGCHDR